MRKGSIEVRSRSVLTGALALALTMAANVAAAQQPPAAGASPIEEMQELDEVVVHGTRLAQRIERAEDRFFKLYNQLNKNDDFDVNCASLPVDGDSRIEGRMCTPSFYAAALADAVVWNFRCRGSEDSEGNYVPPPPCYTPPAPELVLIARTDEFTKNVMDVIRANPELGEMAGELDELHHERNLLQRRYQYIKARTGEERAARNKYKPKIR